MKFYLRVIFLFQIAFSGILFGQDSSESAPSDLSPFEKAELRRLLELDFLDLSRTPIRSVLGYEQEHWRNPA